MTHCHQCGTGASDDDRFCSNCGASLGPAGGAGDPLIGRSVGGAYTLQELVGVGGMGRVYRAEQQVLGRTVAVKVIHPHLLGDEQTVARFYNEARAASRLNHPNSVGVIDFGRTDDGILYLVMEFLRGKDLAMVMHEEGPLPFTRICDVLADVLAALGEAHALGVVHRDLKPENILLKQLRSGKDLVKVVDFGLATLLGGGSATAITSPGLVCGTPDYMSPEQGRGDGVDGRGDLYSLGVVLFELLTERLPFEDETPTKVVLRHINDPVPDPRQLAPHRHITDALADLTARALAKKPDDRFANAEEFEAEIRRVSESLRAPRASEIACPACGAKNPGGMRFCGTCGTRLAAVYTSPPPTGRSSPPRLSYLPTHHRRRLVGRQRELTSLLEARDEALGRPVFVHVAGEAGVGKTRLVDAFAERASIDGDLVVGAGPHPSRAPVPYHPIASLLGALLDVEPEQLGGLAASDDVFGEPLTRAGVAEVADPRGLAGAEERGRAGAVAAAMVTAIGVAMKRSESGRVCMIADEVSRFDGLSQQVLVELARQLGPESVLVLSTGSAAPSGLPAREIALGGLPADGVVEFLSDGAVVDGVGELGGHGALPLYLEQIQGAGGVLDGPDDTLPPRLADAVALRIERLDFAARRVLQAAAVLGDSCPIDWLRELVPDRNLGPLQSLEAQELVEVVGDHVHLWHPFVRDLVESSIPASARRALHERALQIATKRSAPLEERAEHAYRTGETFGALMILERMGDLALRRGDPVAAVLAYRRALELARREMLESGDPALEEALVTFSRKLGEALERHGDVVGADGVLREALDLGGENQDDSYRMWLALGRVAGRRGKPRDALRQLGRALELAERAGDALACAMVHRAVADVRRSEGDTEAALAALERATERLEAGTPDAALRARTHLEHGSLLVQEGAAHRARGPLDAARHAAEEAGHDALLADVTGELGRLSELEGAIAVASQRYREAARLAAEAGDAASHERWRRAAAALDAPVNLGLGTA